MKRLIDLSSDEARAHFLKGSSYFSHDLPPYLSFEPILLGVANKLGGNGYAAFKASDPKELPDVNYSFIANKEHPVIYVSLVNAICADTKWQK